MMKITEKLWQHQHLDQHIKLHENDIHIWLLDCHEGSPLLKTVSQYLNRNEQDKANAFKFELDQQRYTIARGGLRYLLSHYTNQEADQLIFIKGPKGKPYLANSNLPIEFNLSHSGQLAVCAIGIKQPLGIDIECATRHTDIDAITKHYFAKSEQAVILNSVSPLKEEVFFNAWVRKEAYLKAVGHGLMSALDTIEVTCKPEDSAQLIRVPDAYPQTLDWHVHAFSPGENYFGALVTPVDAAAIQYYQLSR